MKKQTPKKLRLSRETLRSLEETNLREGVGRAAAAGSFNPCTNVISDCYECTGRLDTCPDRTIVVS
ncbi:MAG: hypothetical protein QOF89_4642 [Acidobacteriota bacterium]|jgi:hypothetical protein|nr:hypothetical protein [Acidobacteriota bacterium]